MTEEAEQSQQPETQKIQVPIPPDLDYLYRDVVNVFVGTGDVVFELDNIHRSMPSSATISNRIVFIKATDYDLHNRLGQAFAEAQQQLQQNLNR
jgi:hypothetical protein